MYYALFDVLNERAGLEFERPAAQHATVTNLFTVPPPPLGLTMEPVLDQMDHVARALGLPTRQDAYGLKSTAPDGDVDSDEEDVGQLKAALGVAEGESAGETQLAKGAATEESEKPTSSQ